MSRRTNILVEVEDEVYSEVVEPMKKAKTFSKFIASLINGYLSDPYIRSYADGNMEELHRAAIGGLDETVSRMKETLSELGLFSDDLEGSLETGAKKFEQKAKTTSDEILKGKGFSGRIVREKVSEPAVGEEEGGLERRISAVESAMEEQRGKLDDILNILKAGYTPAVKEEKPEGTVPMLTGGVNGSGKNPVVKPVEKPVKDVGNGPAPQLHFIDSGEESIQGADEEEEANSFLESMLGGNSYSF